MEHKDKKKRKEYKHQWYLKNRDKILKEYKKWYQKNRERHLKIVKEYGDRKRREQGCRKYDGKFDKKEYTRKYQEKKRREKGCREYKGEWKRSPKDWRNKYYKIRKKYFVDMLGSKCKVCGYFKCLSALEFHHTNPKEKEGKQEWRGKKSRFEKKIKEGKIELLCANCHREFHNNILVFASCPT